MPFLVDRADIIERIHDCRHDALRFVNQGLIVGPFALALAAFGRVAPIGVGGVITEDLADAGAVDQGRRVLDDIEIDIDRFRHRPVDIPHIALEAQPRAMAKGRVHRHGCRHLEQGQPQFPGEEFGDIQGLPAAQADDAAAVGQLGHFIFQFVAIDGGDEIGTREVVVKVAGEEFPEIVHGDHEIGTMRDVGQFAN